MLNQYSITGNPTVKEPTAKVRVLVPIFVAGRAFAIGDVTTMPMSDALYSKNMCTPSRVEIL